MDILYFLGYDIDEPLPWHSTVSRTRQLYPSDIFEVLFNKVFTIQDADLFSPPKVGMNQSATESHGQAIRILQAVCFSQLSNFPDFLGIFTGLEVSDCQSMLIRGFCSDSLG